MSTQEKLHWLRLARSENIGKSTFFRLIDIFGSAQKALAELSEFAASGGLKRKIKICSAEDAENELINSQNFGAEIIIFSEKKYPRLLREIPDPTPILTVKGDTDFFNRDTIAIVGPRNASFNAVTLAKKIALELGQHSIVIASGLARGVDCAAHEASMLSGTIAVIGGGINHIYPRENQALYENIAKCGLLVSESPFNMTPKGGHFVQRNRLISGLSLGTVVVEAGLRSGSLTTARFSTEQGREVFSVPGSPFDPRCHGTNRLIKDGAKMFETIDDILDELPNLRARFSDAGILREPDFESFEAPISKMPDESEIRKIRTEIYERLNSTPTLIEEIIAEIQAPTRFVNIALVQLELADKIVVNLGEVAIKI